MSNITEYPPFALTKISIFDVIDKNSTIKAIKKMCVAYQVKRKQQKGHNKGGVVSSTYDLIHALIACIAPTKEDLKRKQPKLFNKWLLEGETFVFVYRGTLATKINNNGKYREIQISKETVSNQIKRLLEIGILTKKNNYNVRKEGKALVNPLPRDLNPKGRGKIQLFFNPSIIKFKPKFEALKANLNKTFLQYTTSCLSNKGTYIEYIINNAQTVNKEKVSAKADAKSNYVMNEEQDCKIAGKSKLSKCQFDRKISEVEDSKRRIEKQLHSGRVPASTQTEKDYINGQMVELFCHYFYPNRLLSLADQDKAKKVVQQTIDQLEQDVRNFKSKQIQRYEQRAAYKNAKTEVQSWMLTKFQKKLPNAYRGAIEILSFAIRKQAIHAKRNDYLSTVGKPGNFMLSYKFSRAIHYSIIDWEKSNSKHSNKIHDAYCKFQKAISKTHSNILKESFKNHGYAYTLSVEAYHKFYKQLMRSNILSESHKKALDQMFKDKLSPLFRNIPLKNKIKLSQLAA